MIFLYVKQALKEKHAQPCVEKEIFDKAKEFRKIRKLTPGEQSILDNLI